MNADAPRIAGFVPALNANATLAEALRSLRAQSPAVSEILVVDDASDDDTSNIAASAGARVERLPTRSGRGAARSRGASLLEADLILSLDSGNRLAPDFLARALPLFADPRVAAVVGHWAAPVGSASLSVRWRARHLFKTDRQRPTGAPRTLATHGCLLRRAAVLEVGNFDAALRHSEDVELGDRLLARGWRVLACAEARVEPQRADSLPALAERYWRWHAGARERWSLRSYRSHFVNSLRLMAPLDLRARDLPALVFTLLLPHAVAALSLARLLSGKAQR